MIYIAIVNHGHEALLMSGNLERLGGADDRIKVVVKDNKPSTALKTYCDDRAIDYIDTNPGLGFGHNNNLIYQHVQKNFGFLPNDTFIVMNPDVTIDGRVVIEFVEHMRHEHCQIATLNLFRDKHFQQPDTNIRHFPHPFSLTKMGLNGSLTAPYEKETILAPCFVDWASGAFLAFDAAYYAALGGFDLRYFMYFEDVDICFRSRALLGKGVRYYPQFRAVHTAAHQNRRFGSKHALWFMQSYFKFVVRRIFSAQHPRMIRSTGE